MVRLLTSVIYIRLVHVAVDLLKGNNSVAGVSVIL